MDNIVEKNKKDIKLETKKIENESINNQETEIDNAKVENQEEKSNEDSKKVVITKKMELDERLEKAEKISDAIDVYNDAIKALKKEKIVIQDLRYIEKQIAEKFFNEDRFEKFDAKVLVKIALKLVDEQEFDNSKLEIIELGNHFQENEKINDFVCIYNGRMISIFGIFDRNNLDANMYEAKKYIRQENLEAVRIRVQHEEEKYNKKNKEDENIEVKPEKLKIAQYEEYYVVNEKMGLQIYTEKPITALIKFENTTFDKIKSKLSTFFTKGIFINRSARYLPNMVKIYDINKLKNVNEKSIRSKDDAKSRMKSVLSHDRVDTRTQE